ncbi:MAG: nucleotide exchange factor GrpE [Oscillospiraceae bacterium]|nr:nucleotide exchange factor GrpE [Oscillospiraceae bacterium]
MSTEKEKKDTAPVEESAAEESKETAPVEEEPKKEKKSKPKKEKDKESKKAPDLKEAAEKLVREEKDRYLRLAAEYDNFRKRSQKEKDSLYTDIKVDTLRKFLPVYDNLERALKQATADEAYRKGVEMIMAQFKSTMDGLGVTEIAAEGEKFDPEKHNAVMHVEDESFGENEIVEVFQRGFTLGDKVIRFAMVKVAN